MNRQTILTLGVLFTLSINAALADLNDKEFDFLKSLYLHLHQNPELSFKEEQTAARIAEELQALGFSVTRNFGGTGVVGTLVNGAGPTLLIRADIMRVP
jgi:hippurate hydrolase